MGAGKNKRLPAEKPDEKRLSDSETRRDYDPVQEAKHPTEPGRRNKAARDRRKRTP